MGKKTPLLKHLAKGPLAMNRHEKRYISGKMFIF